MVTYNSPEGTYRFYLEQFKSAGWMKTNFSSGFFGVVFGMTADETVESWMLACRMPLLLDSQSPDDVLPYIAEDRRLPRYSTETASSHRNRLWDAWNIYLEAGSEEVIEKQIAAAGWAPDVGIGNWGEDPGTNWGEDNGSGWNDRGARVEFRPDALGPRGEPAPYRTQFWVVFGPTYHPVTGMPKPWGSFVWGDTSEGVWGPQGYSRAFAKDMTGIVKKWKPSDHIFRGFLFEIGYAPWGVDTPDGAWGAPGGVVWGGGIEVPFVV